LRALYDFLKGYGLDVKTSADIETLFQEQNPYLWEWLNEAVDCLEIVIDAINAILGLEVIFLGGHFPNSVVEYLIERLQLEAKAAKASQPDRHIIYQAKLRRATVGDLSPAIGAATLPLYDTFSTEPALLQDDGE
jgi:predicted NBD/HSP70 family sugar kinase